MTLADRINNEYFEWILDLVSGESCTGDFSFRKLLMKLHNIEFVYSIPKDENRAADGIGLRRRFASTKDYGDLSEYLGGPCSVLEMMVALAIRCEENIMDDPGIGDRTKQWFWEMIANLGLNGMYDSIFDRRVVEDAVARLLNREYEPDGRGGLFRVRHCDTDLRTVEIWYQLCWYLDSIT